MFRGRCSLFRLVTTCAVGIGTVFLLCSLLGSLLFTVPKYCSCPHSPVALPYSKEAASSSESVEIACFQMLITRVHHVLPQLEHLSASSIIRSLPTLLNRVTELPTIYVVTPTFHRPVQKAELLRLCHTLRLVPNVFWILVEDSDHETELVTKFLKRCGVMHAHLHIQTPPQFQTKASDPSWLKPKGVLQRNAALEWLRRHLSTSHGSNGVVYFADDDNAYDLELFEEMRHTRKVSVWPVGLVGGLMVEKPLVHNGQVIGWNTLWKPDRPFPIDMAGFAVNVQLLKTNPGAKFSLNVPRGYQESHLLQKLVTVSELEPRANNCTKVLVWHTRTEQPKLKQEKKLPVPSDVGIEL